MNGIVNTNSYTDSSGDTGTAGQILSSTGASGTNWIDDPNPTPYSWLVEADSGSGSPYTVVNGNQIHFKGDTNISTSWNNTNKEVLISLSGTSVTGTGAANQVTYWDGAQTITGAAGFTFAGGATGKVAIGGELEVGGVLTDGTFTGSSGTYTGYASISSTVFVGPLQGNADTATALAAAGTVSMSGDTVAAGVTYTSGGNVPLVSTISDSVVYNKELSGFNATSGSVANGDSIIEALEKLQGQITTLPQGLVYQGVWSAAGTGGGTPDLTQASYKVNGHFYICDTAGTAAPNGAGNPPNDWDVRDWVIFADDGAGGGVDEWQKIDNSSLAGGTGTPNTMTKWLTNQTIGNSNITDNGSIVTIADTIDFTTQGNNTFGNTSADVSSFLGNVTLNENLILAKGLSLGSSYGTAGQVLTSGGGVNVANTWTTPTTGTVESVGLTHYGDAFVVTVTNGSGPNVGLAIAAKSGAAATDYINGLGNITAFPTLDNYVDWKLQGDSGTNQDITKQTVVDFAGGTYITTATTADTLTINHDATSRTDTTSTDGPAFGGTFEAVTSVTSNATGHVTAIDVSTVTIPFNPVMTAATAAAAGVQGLVPGSAAGDQLKFLRADATWVVPTNTEGVTAVTATAPISSTGGDTPVISHDASGVTAGTYDSVTVDAKGHVTAGTNPGGSGGGIFSGDQTITNSTPAQKAFTLNRATTGTLIFDVWFTSETSIATSVAKKYTVAHANNATPVYNKIIDTGPAGSNDFTVSFVNAGSGLSVECYIIGAGIASQNIGYTVQVGHDSTNALTFTAAS